jgi:hypothetical protein
VLGIEYYIGWCNDGVQSRQQELDGPTKSYRDSETSCWELSTTSAGVTTEYKFINKN